MELSRRLMIHGMSATLPFLAFHRAAFAATVVKVSLWDKGEASMDRLDTMVPMGMAMPAAGMGMATMGITSSLVEIPAGDVTFRVTNESREFYHSLAISRVKDLAAPLPYLSDTMMVDEHAAGLVAKGKELKPHASGDVTVALQPGTHILYCNISGHYMMGMWTLVKIIA